MKYKYQLNSKPLPKVIRVGLLSLSIIAAAILAQGILPSARVNAAAYNYTNYLMDDSVYRASSTMSISDIQSFLQNKGSGLTSFSDTEACGNDARGAMMSAYAPYYACGSLQPASKIIYDVAQAYGMNPQVLLATMQKEQSLVTTPNPTASQLNFAMGYGCPDSTGCSNSYPGFFAQVAWAAWQFRYNYEAIYGNSYGGYTAASYPCNGPTKYYSAALKTGNNVTFLDEVGTAYANFVLPNAATSSFYCYTPHAYPGSSQYYYSGSKNFVSSFNLWFVPYALSYYSQSAHPNLNPGQAGNVWLEYRNNGYQTWYDDASLSTAPSGTNPVHLAASHPLNRSSAFSADWPTSSRPDVNFSAVYNQDGTTLAANQHVVQPGQIAKFGFNITATFSGVAASTYTEYFQPIMEGSSAQFNDPGANVQVTINPVANVAWSSQSSYPTVFPTDTQTVSASFVNSGNLPLYDDSSLTGASAGTHPTHLAVSCPVNTASDFTTSDWANSSRPSVNFSQVYLSDGSTLALNQHIAQPGQIFKYSFKIKVPNNYVASTYKLCIQPILEGTSGGYFSDLGVYLNVTVPSAPVISYASSVPTTLSLVSGEQKAQSYQLVNLGNSTLATGATVVTSNGQAYRDISWKDNVTVTTLAAALAPGSSSNVQVLLLAPITDAGVNDSLNFAINDSAGVLVHDSSVSTATRVMPPKFTASYYSQSQGPSFTYGQTKTIFYSYKNIGNKPWYDDSSIGTATKTRTPQPTHLATANPINRLSGFASGWPSPSRPAVVFTAVYETDGTTLAADQHVVQPGQIAKYGFNVTPASWVNPGTYQEYVQPIIEGTPDGAINSQGTYHDYALATPTFEAAYYSESSYPSLTKGQVQAVNLEYKNTGNATWFDDISFPSAPANSQLYPVHLATSQPLNRTSDFSAGWPSPSRPAVVFTAVYETDGTTLAADQHVVQPGQIAKYVFNISVPATYVSGQYKEYFQVIAEGTQYGAFGNPGTFFTINVN